MNVLIREAEPKDIPILANLMNQLGYPTSEDDMTKRMNTIFNDKNFYTFLAIDVNKVVGMVGFHKSLKL